MKDLFNKLCNEFSLSDWEETHQGQFYFKVPQVQARSLICRLKDLHGFGHLVFFSAVDHIESERFHLLYLLHNYKEKVDFGVTVEIKRENSEMESIHDLWPAARTYQQELRELFGIDFPGSPGVNENFVLEGWEDIPPMRREFDSLSYSEKTYYPRAGRKTEDTRETQKKKLYPSEAETW